ncbi:carbonic anhydrase [Pseudonocardia nematodicida]|uniref:carbonic anhydrase n=1 Tax=Pseudonocardia nematodicida TaxID=1206997 RepID=A0ABV1KDI3_9PSEU
MANDSGRPAAEQVWAELLEGNGRWQRDERESPHCSASAREAAVAGQAPAAMILSCADSRVPAELLFDQGVGDLFVTRTAGQVVDDAVAGTLAYGSGALGIGLLVVLGHSHCGAVKAALGVAAGGEEPFPPALASLVGAIVPVCEGADLPTAVDANVRRIVAQLTDQPGLAEAVADGRLTIVGARYDLETGGVVQV